ncbi:PE-PPE domain-containing protein [Mycolicibacterium palauense]|uniref:PE-PPE domain-containing protein n=1 Tax=Mycolicibacterium palauense TaxID=2034511 RepID=UPI000BFEAD44|nr:PE-PPE domain-containing protein [Mycolicibacterium palauense]
MAESHTSSMLTTLGVAASVVGLTLAQPLATSVAPITLAALIIEGSSTNPSGTGIEDFYHGKFSAPSPIRLNFLTGPSGILRALTQPDNVAGPNIVMSSGWGAANASLLISRLADRDPANPALTNTTWVLDNNVAAPNGGFGTRYPVFALIGVNPVPTPAEAGGAVIISTTHEYDLNGNAPRYVLNGFAALNSLMAYFDRRLDQSALVMPVDADGTVRDPATGDPVDCAASCTFTYPDDAGDIVTVRVTQVGDVSYVGYAAPGLPLTRPLRRFGGDLGNEIADVIEPVLTALVNYGYPDSDPLGDPGTTVRAGLLPTAAERRLFLNNFADGVQQGLASIGVPHQDAPTAATVTDAPPAAAQPSGAVEADRTDGADNGGTDRRDRGDRVVTTSRDDKSSAVESNSVESTADEGSSAESSTDEGGTDESSSDDGADDDSDARADLAAGADNPDSDVAADAEDRDGADAPARRSLTTEPMSAETAVHRLSKAFADRRSDRHSQRRETARGSAASSPAV